MAVSPSPKSLRTQLPPGVECCLLLHATAAVLPAAPRRECGSLQAPGGKCLEGRGRLGGGGKRLGAGADSGALSC
jgi:hypothetical protein